MGILFVGSYDTAGSCIASRMYREGNHVCWLTQEPDRELWNGTVRGKVYRNAVTYSACRQIIQGESIDTIFFLTGNAREAYLEEEMEQAYFLHTLIPVLRAAARSRIRCFCYLSSLDLGSGQLLPPVFEELRAGERMVRSYGQEHGISWLILRMGCVFERGMEHPEGFAVQILSDMTKKKTAVCSFTPESEFDFICGSDLADGVYRLLDMESEGIYSISTGHGTTVKELYDLAAQASGFQGKVNYGENVHSCGLEEGTQIRRECGWMPFYLFEDQGLAYLQDVLSRKRQGETKGQRKWKERIGSHPMIWQTAQNLVLFAAAWMLSRHTADWSDLRYVDVRLLYVTAVAISFGMRQGMLATALAAVSYSADLLQSGIDLSYLFYSVESWVPYIVYGMAGALAGYWSDRKNDEADGAADELAEQKERYQFLKDLYREVVQVKNQLQKQIVISKDSFSHIYAVTEELDVSNPRLVFFRAVKVIEEIMECRSAAIYLKPEEESNYGRLIACSEPLAQKLAPSVDFGRLPRIFQAMEQGNMYVNQELDPQYPAFAVPVLEDARVIALAVLYEISPDQYTAHYKNLFQTLVRMIQHSLVRAYRYQEDNKERIYLDGTHIYTAQAFEQQRKALKTAGEEYGLPFSVARIELPADQTAQQSYQKLQSLMRGSDLLGQGEDKELQAAFLYVQPKNRPLLERRLRDHGFTVRWEG